ncbi:MAG: hypothetical protein IPG93_17175 [Burkholderiales bacterium]|nr:hypothetical protein [Burkholderiales bacterium]
MRVVLWVVAGLLVLAGLAALWVSNRPGADLGEVFRQRLTALPALPPPRRRSPRRTSPGWPPEPVQRWLRHAGVVGRPPVRAVHVTFDATLYSALTSPACAARRTRWMCSIRRGACSTCSPLHGGPALCRCCTTTTAGTTPRCRCLAGVDVADLPAAAVAHRRR